MQLWLMQKPWAVCTHGAFAEASTPFISNTRSFPSSPATRKLVYEEEET